VTRKGKKKANGEGSIYQRKTSDSRWVGQYTDKQGKTRYVYGKTQKEVRIKLTKVLADRDSGLIFDACNLALGQYLDRWLEDSVRHSVKPTTYESYSQLVRNHITPALGGKKLKDLTPDHVRRFRSFELEKGLSTRTAQYLLFLLRKALQQAVEDGLLPRNVAQGVKVKQTQKDEVQYLTREEAKALLSAARGDRLEALYVLAINTGLRQGELLGLKWEDIDLDAGTLSVRRTLSRTKDGPRFTEPKTAKSRRSVKLTAPAVKGLKHHRAAQDEERARLGSLWEENGLVFRSTTSTPLRRYNLVPRSFKPLLERAGLSRTVRFHDLRHTAASLLFSKGVHPKVVQEMLGHSTITITLDTYSHVLPDMQDRAVNAMEDALS
jgi:integrase